MLRFAATKTSTETSSEGSFAETRSSMSSAFKRWASGGDDPSVLQWAADQGRVVVTHDISTLTKHALDRVAAGQPMPGVFEVKSAAPIGQIIDDLILVADCSFEGGLLPSAQARRPLDDTGSPRR
jgi:hypothetical protein